MISRPLILSLIDWTFDPLLLSFVRYQININSAMINLSPTQFIQLLKSENIRRFYFVYNPKSKQVIASHDALKPIADFLNMDERDFMLHEGLFFQLTEKYNILQGAFVHRTNRGQAAGGVRYWSYDNMEDYIRDGLRLAKGMTYKNALAGLWWGGGKGVMIHNEHFDKTDRALRDYVYSEYGKFLSTLNGCYVTAEDVGTHVADMAQVYSKTRFTTCIPGELGGSGNPSVPTAKGVISGMEAALEAKGLGTLKGKTIAVQGMGNVGAPLIRFLLERGAQKVIAADINPVHVEQVAAQFSDLPFEGRLISREDQTILFEDVDIIAPCATGATLNPETIPQIKAKIICGAANNQLEDSDRDDKALYERGIVYIPDFLTNRMGIVNCANEQYGYVNLDPLIENHFSRDWKYSVHQMVMQVLSESEKASLPPAIIANKIADKLSLENHPIMGHRSQKIIDSLVENEWHKTDALVEV
jgi:glutamate dehydrogenase/leucine dehydrogenase